MPFLKLATGLGKLGVKSTIDLNINSTLYTLCRVR